MSDLNLSRRSFFGTMGMGALGAILPQNLAAASASKGLHHAPKAKRVIMLLWRVVKSA